MQNKYTQSADAHEIAGISRRALLIGSVALGLGATLAITMPLAAGPESYFFAAGRLRSPVDIGKVTSDRQFTLHKIEFISPDYPTNSFRVALPAHYTLSGKLPSEAPSPSPFTIRGTSLQALIGEEWQSVRATIGGAESAFINPGVGVLTDDVIFPQDIPPNTRMASLVAIQASDGASIPVGLPARIGTFEGAVRSADERILDQLDQTGRLDGNDGRLSGRLYSASFIVAKATTGLDRPVFWVNGDSIGYGKNANENVLTGPAYNGGTGAMGFIGVALEDAANSTRMSYYNSCIPGTGASEQQFRKGWPLKLDLIRLVPNRPYTHIITQHLNGGPTGDYQTIFKPAIKIYYNLLADESRAWGDDPAPIYQTRPIARPGVWPYSLEVQTPSDVPYPSGQRWQFDAELVAGNSYPELAGIIDVNAHYAYDQDKNRDKVAVPDFVSVVTAPYDPSTRKVMLQDSPVIGTFLLFGPGEQNLGVHVTGVSGDGPFEVTIANNFGEGFDAGVLVQAVLAGDQIGLHPATEGHALLARGIIEWKNATFG